MIVELEVSEVKIVHKFVKYKKFDVRYFFNVFIIRVIHYLSRQLTRLGDVGKATLMRLFLLTVA